MENSTKPTFWVWLLLGISLSLNLYGIDWGLPNGAHDWANDSVAPLEPLAYAKRLIYQEPWWSKYPPFHFMVLAAVYAPYALYLYLSGGLVAPTDIYPYGLSDPESSLMVFTLLARITSALMGTGTVLVSYFTVKKLYDYRAGLVSALLIAACPAVIYYSHNANVDMPQLFWISLALYSFVSLLETFDTKYYVYLALFAAFAIGTKNSAAALFFGLLVPLIWFHVRHDRGKKNGGRLMSSLFDRRLLLGFSVFMVALILVFNLPVNWQGFVDHIQFHLGRSVKGSKIIRESAAPFQGDFNLIARYLFYLLQSNGLAAFPLLVGGFFYCFFKSPAKSWTFLFPIATFYIFFLRVHGSDHMRYMLPVYLIFTWQAGKLAADLLDHGRLPKLISVSMVLLILGHSLAYGFSLDLLLTRDSRYSAEKWMRNNIAANSVVAAFGPIYSLPRFSPAREVRHIPVKRGGITVKKVPQNSDYLVLAISSAGRVKMKRQLYQSFSEKGYRPVASFKSETPLFGVELFHAVNPEIVIFQQVQDRGSP